jgi:hypothetical protein
MALTKYTVFEQEWIQRYLQNKLSTQENQEFELFMLEHPEVAKQVQLDAVFQYTLQEAQGKAREVSILESIKWIWHTPLRASFCTLVVCAGLFSLWFSMANPAAVISSQVVYLEPLRSGVSELPTIHFREQDSQVALVVQSYFEDPDDIYNVRVIAKDSQRLVYQQSVQGNAQGELLVVLNRQNVHPGDFIIEVSNPEEDMPQRVSFYLATD